MEIHVLEIERHRRHLHGCKSLGAAVMTESKRMRHGALAFWLVVACLVTARIILVDPSSLHPGSAVSATTPAVEHGRL
jgi:exosortase/archaeosortase